MLQPKSAAPSVRAMEIRGTNGQSASSAALGLLGAFGEGFAFAFGFRLVADSGLPEELLFREGHEGHEVVGQAEQAGLAGFGCHGCCVKRQRCGESGGGGAIAAAARTGNGSKACCVFFPYFLIVSFTPKFNETTTSRNRMR